MDTERDDRRFFGAWVVFGTTQVAVEHAAGRIAGRVLETVVDLEAIHSGRPRSRRNEGPGALLWADRD
jgi:hypothetical protein